MNVTTWMTCGHRAASVWVPGALCAETLGRCGGRPGQHQESPPPLAALLFLGTQGLGIFDDCRAVAWFPWAPHFPAPISPEHAAPSSPAEISSWPKQFEIQAENFFSPLHRNGILRGLFSPKEAQFSLTIKKCHGIIFMRPVPAAYIKIADLLS